ncbi:carbamoyl-phosphate synthase large subunit [Weissella diestrammenae]|uniref:Carbamoyl-phosphate synthase large subunit n=1 Tax=Weissella diestrammenae TaxID=1162633 RepID=A0A7G9T4M0_9LACO|nr:carbamoyl-phosphate synthase large subunit [Weissella diestrammenae]MCM0582072.1 carbamoyl-phosphate synthase large subunit [Weissella diestrammenae]QNN75045.1 carbamoyl-phosphate synthase large subunit [Weissella diestrammenae]
MSERILIIGGSANDFGRETESDTAGYQMVSMLRKRGHDVFLVDDNPYNFTIERTDITPILTALTLPNLLNIIQEYAITSIMASIGGLTAIRLSHEILVALGSDAPKILGLSVPVIEAAQNTKVLKERLVQIGEEGVRTRLVASVSEAFDAVRDFNFPVVVRPVAPSGETLRLHADDAEELEETVQTALERSLTHQVNIDQGIGGYREITIVAMRDIKDNALMIGGVEDMDPVGIHTADSIAVTPLQTLPDPIVQKLRHSAFQVMRGFKMIGLAEIRFAVNPETETYVVTRVTPYFDRQAALIMVSTGYPLVPVMTGLLLGETFDSVDVPQIYAQNTALLEPVMDHVVMRFPVFSFGELEADWIVTDHRLDTIQKSVGATIGVGRSVEEALEKAIRAAHFNNRNFSPTVMNSLSDDALVEQIIHPRDNRILVLIEALRRGYTVDELAEVTKIDPFYFYKLRRIMQIETNVVANPWNEEALKDAKYYGLSDGLIAKLWHDKYENVRRYRWDKNILPTFKAFDPSAGEFEEATSHYYSTFETENESHRLSDESALVIGTGAFRLGDGAAASYAMASVASELRTLGIKTIAMNNNPHDLLFIPQIADKHYYEPLELSDVMSILEIEQPKYVFIPGNRIKLIAKLREMGVIVNVIAKEKYLPSSLSENYEQTVINYFWDGDQLHPIALAHQDNGGIVIDQQVLTESLYESLPKPTLNISRAGMYQLVVDRWPIDDAISADDIRPMPFTHIAFLSKITGINWIRLVVRYLTERQTESDQFLVTHWRTVPWRINAARLTYFDPDYDEHLHVNALIDNGRFAMGATFERIN